MQPLRLKDICIYAVSSIEAGLYLFRGQVFTTPHAVHRRLVPATAQSMMSGVVRLAHANHTQLRHLHLLLQSIGILMPRSRAVCWASSYPASACRTTPSPGSLLSTRAILRDAISVPSATVTCPA
jgi:hypothetical protein